MFIKVTCRKIQVGFYTLLCTKILWNKIQNSLNSEPLLRKLFVLRGPLEQVL